MAAINEKKKVLVVDDDEVHIAVARGILKDEYEVFTAKSGQEAMDHFVCGLIPHLLLLDIVMPDMDGWEIFNRIKALSYLKNVPIVFLTSVTKAAEARRALEIGADDYITKPYDKSELLSRIKMILERKEKNN